MATHTMQLSEDDVLEYENDGHWIHSDLPEPDPTWRGTDSNGHEHYYAESANHYPTLRRMESEPYWCADCHDEHTDSWLECPICGEKVTPGTRPSKPVWISTWERYLLNGEPISGERANEILNEARQARDEAMKLRERPAVGSRVRLDGEPVTVMPTVEAESDTRVTVMRHGSGDMDTVDLDQLRREQ